VRGRVAGRSWKKCYRWTPDSLEPTLSSSETEDPRFYLISLLIFIIKEPSHEFGFQLRPWRVRGIAPGSPWASSVAALHRSFYPHNFC
jgi:hypothetical protein